MRIEGPRRARSMRPSRTPITSRARSARFAHRRLGLAAGQVIASRAVLVGATPRATARSTHLHRRARRTRGRLPAGAGSLGVLAGGGPQVAPARPPAPTASTGRHLGAPSAPRPDSGREASRTRCANAVLRNFSTLGATTKRSSPGPGGWRSSAGGSPRRASSGARARSR